MMSTEVKQKDKPAQEAHKRNSITESGASRLQMGNKLLEYVKQNKTMEFEVLIDNISQSSISDLEWILNDFADPHFGDTLLIKAAYRSNFHLVDLLLKHKVNYFKISVKKKNNNSKNLQNKQN